MSSELSISMKNQAVKLYVAGKLVGHVARNCFSFLRQLAGQKYSIVLDLSDCTSVDSVGMTIFDWIQTVNGSVDVKVIPPILECFDRNIIGVKFSGISIDETLPARNSGIAATQPNIVL